MLLILSHLAEAGHSGPILPFFKSKTKKHSCCAAVSSLSCVTGLEPGKNDAKGQNRQSMFSYIFFFRLQKVIAMKTSAIGQNYRYCYTFKHSEWKSCSIPASQCLNDGWELLFYFLAEKQDFFFLSPEHPYHNLLNPQCALREPLGFMETVLQPDPCTQ